MSLAKCEYLLVELGGLEPPHPPPPTEGSTSAAVCMCRSASQGVRSGPLRIPGLVAVLSCCNCSALASPRASTPGGTGCQTQPPRCLTARVSSTRLRFPLQLTRPPHSRHDRPRDGMGGEGWRAWCTGLVHQASMITSWPTPGADGVMQAEADDAAIVGVERPTGGGPSTGPKASISGFHRLDQLRPGPESSAPSPSRPGPDRWWPACPASRSWSCCFHCLRS